MITWFQRSFPALGSTAQVVATSPQDLRIAHEIVAAEIDAIDHACSRFRDDSILSQVNTANGDPVDVTPLFAEALRVALRAARMTSGLVDPTVGRALVAIGYDRDFASIGSVRSTRPFEPAGGWAHVMLDDARLTVRIPAGVALDLGATAKALCADRAARAVSALLDGGVLINLGGDIAVAGPAPDGGWPVRVTDDHRADADAEGQTIHMFSGGLATSSTTVRRWKADEGFVHHIVDPATGAPARDVWQTVSVAAASCVDANTAATAAIVMGDDAPVWLASKELPSRLVDARRSVRCVAGWPREDDR